MSQNKSQSFYNLSIDDVMACAEQQGFSITGEYFQLNSYENRVFDLFLERDSLEAPANHVIVKVYRPQRWTIEALLEEHKFLNELTLDGLSVVEPVAFEKQQTVVHYKDMAYSFYPKAQGRLVQELTRADFQRLGRLLAQLHNTGSRRPTEFRPHYNVENYGWQALEILQDWVAPEVWDRYQDAGDTICHYLESTMDESLFIRIHGDFHKGNILQSDPLHGEKEDFIVDFDDFAMGPEAQDFWMLLSDEGESSKNELDFLLEGYTELRNFNEEQLDWIPALRGLRIMKYAAWIAQRWEDPSFPKLFPNYEKYIYWAEEVEALERIAWSL